MTHQLIKASELVGLPVVSVDGGEDIAEIKDVVFDGTAHKLIGFTLNKRGWFRGSLRQDLPADSISAIGPDAVMVASAGDLEEPADSPAALSGDAPTHAVLGSRVLSSDGSDLGEVTDVVISTGASFTAVGYEIETDDGDKRFVPISAQLALSDSNLLIPAEASPFIRNDLAGFGAAVEEYRALLDNATLGAQS